MTISAELFLADNMLMDYLILRLAAAIVGKRLRGYIALPTAAAAAGYALLSMTAWPVLASAPAKLLSGAAMATVLVTDWRGYWKCLIALYLSAFLTGGMMLALCVLFGGRLSGGALMGTVPLRLLLIAAALCAALPRIARALISAYRHRTRHVRLRLELGDRVLTVWALVDSGNLLTEPVSGLPVVVLRKGLLPKPVGGRPVPYAVMGAEGWLDAFRPQRMSALLGGWIELDVYVAEAPDGLGAEEAVIGADILTSERRMQIDDTTQDAVWEAVEEDTGKLPKGAAVYSLRGDAADAVSAGGGSGVDRKTDERG